MIFVIRKMIQIRIMARILKNEGFKKSSQKRFHARPTLKGRRLWRNRSEPAVTNTWSFWFTPLSCCSTYPVTPLHSRVITATFCGRFRHMTEGKRDWKGVRFSLIDGPIFAFHDSHLKEKKSTRRWRRPRAAPTGIQPSVLFYYPLCTCSTWRIINRNENWYWWTTGTKENYCAHISKDNPRST